jgi:hypothetical protein
MSKKPRRVVASEGPSHRMVEIGVAVAMIVFALIAITGSVKAGIGWGSEGPRAGFFPFYVGLTILGCSIINIIHAMTQERRGDLFAQWGQLQQVLEVVIPTAIYVAVIPWTGIYLASMVLIAFFMHRLGKYAWSLIMPIAIGVPVAFFLVFERWFLVPLPKGPIENWLGF